VSFEAAAMRLALRKVAVSTLALTNLRGGACMESSQGSQANSDV